MLESLPVGRTRSLHELFPAASSEARDMMLRCMFFNPGKRASCQQLLKHQYVLEFHKPEEELSCPRVIRIALDDDKKLTVQDYRERLYHEVVRRRKDQREERRQERRDERQERDR